MGRMFGGAMALLSIQMALFIIVYGKYQETAGRAEETTWGVLALISGGLIVGSGISALAAHLYSGPDSPIWPHWLFALVLVVATSSPLVIWALA